MLFCYQFMFLFSSNCRMFFCSFYWCCSKMKSLFAVMQEHNHITWHTLYPSSGTCICVTAMNWVLRYKEAFLKYLLRCTGELCVCTVFVCCLFALLWCLDWKCVVPGNYSSVYLHKTLCNASPFHWVIYVIFILLAFGRIRKLLMDLILWSSMIKLYVFVHNHLNYASIYKPQSVWLRSKFILENA